jgi:hypothetical protein
MVRLGQGMTGWDNWTLEYYECVHDHKFKVVDLLDD